MQNMAEFVILRTEIFTIGFFLIIDVLVLSAAKKGQTSAHKGHYGWQ